MQPSQYIEHGAQHSGGHAASLVLCSPQNYLFESTYVLHDRNNEGRRVQCRTRSPALKFERR